MERFQMRTPLIAKALTAALPFLSEPGAEVRDLLSFLEPDA